MTLITFKSASVDPLSYEDEECSGDEYDDDEEENSKDEHNDGEANEENDVNDDSVSNSRSFEFSCHNNSYTQLYGF